MAGNFVRPASVLSLKFMAYFNKRAVLPNDRKYRSLDYARDDNFMLCILETGY